MREDEMTDEEIQMVVALMRLGGWGWHVPGNSTADYVVDVKGKAWFQRWKAGSLERRMPTYRRIWAHFPTAKIPAEAQPTETLSQRHQ